jgi:hypothetical protein
MFSTCTLLVICSKCETTDPGLDPASSTGRRASRGQCGPALENHRAGLVEIKVVMDPIAALDPFPEPRAGEFLGERGRVVGNPEERQDEIGDEPVRELALAMRQAEEPEPRGRGAGLN